MTHSFPTRRSSDLRHGKDRDIVDLGGRKHFFGALFAAFGALFEHHVDRDDEQHDPARDAETGEVDVQEAQQRFAATRANYEEQPGDAEGARKSVGKGRIVEISVEVGGGWIVKKQKKN